MNLPQLYYFKKLAEVQHYTRAAKELYITQPTLSNSISQLERELEIPLFERENRAVKLTRYGKEFYRYITDALEALDKGVDIAHEHAGSLSGSIEIGTVYTIQGDYLPALMASYRKQYGPNITANICQGLTLPLIEDLENDRYEVAFTAYVAGKPELTFVPVFMQQLVAVMHSSHPLAQKPEVTFDDLQSAGHLRSYPPSTPIGMEVENALREHGAGKVEAPYCNDEITLASVVESDQDSVGLALNTIGLVPFRELVVKRIAGLENEFHPICMAYKTSAFKTRALENFISFVKNSRWTGSEILPKDPDLSVAIPLHEERPKIVAPFVA